MEPSSISELDLVAAAPDGRQILLIASFWVQEEQVAAGKEEQEAAGQEEDQEPEAAEAEPDEENDDDNEEDGEQEEDDDENGEDQEQEEEEDDNDDDDDNEGKYLPAFKARDLQLMDVNGNVVRVFKGMGGSGTVCTSVDDLICVTGGSSNGAHVLDPSTGKMLMYCSKIEVRKYGESSGVVTPYFTTFGFGRAAGPSRAYKAVRLSDAGACEVLTIGDGARWRTVQPPCVVPSNRGSPVCIRGVMYFPVGKEESDDNLLCFCLESEQWEKRPMEGPQKLVADEEWQKTAVIHVTELSGDLCMVQSLLQMTVNPRAIIWLRTELNSGSWIKMYTIKMAPSTCLYMPLMLRDDGKLLLHCTTGVNYDEVETMMLQLYDPSTGTCSDVAKMPRNLIKRIGVCRWISFDGHV